MLAPYPDEGTGSEIIHVRRLPLILAIVFSVAAFLTLGNNLFTLLNVTLWIMAIVLFVLAFWKSPEARTPFWSKLKDIITRDAWQINVTRWTLLLLAVVAVVIFFRVYNIGGVPSEPFSDHAEKLLDVYDVSQGQTHIFFPRNTGREAIQMYLTLVVSWILSTGLSFLSLKIGTVFCGLVTLPYMYMLGKEFGGKRIGLLAVFFAGIAYWPNVISRAGLRFPLYPLFVAPTFYYLLRGLRRRSRNDMIISGLFLGLGLHGYTPFRIVPFAVVIAVMLYLLHAQSKGNRKQAITWLAILALTSLIVFLPLARYWVDNPQVFDYRAFTRLGSLETPLPAPAWQVFLSNTWNALRMFNWDDGEIWVHSVTHRPALDVVTGALFLIAVVLVLIRYIRQRQWQDLFLLLAVPLLQLPSILSLAFPGENPALNRAAGAMVPTFLLVAVALDGLLASISFRMNRRVGAALTWLLVIVLFTWSSAQNFDLVFNQYATEYSSGAWNSSEMGAVIKQFGQTYGSTDKSWIVPYPYWVDTRLPGVWAGIPNRDFAIWPQDFNSTLDVQGAKLFIVNVDDTADKDELQTLYPHGVWSRFISKTKLEGKDFMIFLIPPTQ
jgi:4-amino-4-deoxy-L-arabinose transferase-like glycosyltransferase